MENRINVKSEYNSLAKLTDYLKKETSFEASIDYDSWDIRTDANGQMEKCVLLKKSSMHGLKMYFNKSNELVISYIIPNKIMNAYFGKSVKARKNILEIVTGIIKSALLSGSQKKAYEEMELDRGFKETDPLGGYDPYSSSKGCSELVTSSYRNSFFNKNKNSNTENIELSS